MKPIVAIFAHPDDEAFGPGGSLAKLTKHHDVYIICVTRGDAGNNHSGTATPLADIRADEMRASAKILGVKAVFFLRFADGSLCNNLYHDVANQIRAVLDKLQPSLIMTFEHLGVSGHLDHIAVSMITTFLFEKLAYIKTIYYFCNPIQFKKHFKDYFIYFPPGYKKSQIDKTIDVRDVWEKKLAAMREHKSQRPDIDKLLPLLESLPHAEHFLVKEK